MSLYIPNMELKSLWIGEGGLPRREEEREGAHGGGEAPAAAPLSGASASAVPAPPLGPAGGNPVLGKSATIFRAL